ncbi:hypothetical protein QS257_21080 [Terrilactibacillus sp. S3-3]|nr:hypothetical protein QS257_21080 [Terrilactibacillus sp. S3-3]
MIAALMMVLSACGSQENSAYDQAVQKGFNAVRSGNYDKESLFKKALQNRKGDKQAAALVTYTLVLKTAQQALNQGNFDDAISSANIVIKQEKDSDAVLAKAQVIRKAALEAKQKQADQSAAAQVSSSKTAENTAAQTTSSESAGGTAGKTVSSGSNSSTTDSSTGSKSTASSQNAASQSSSSAQNSQSDAAQGNQAGTSGGSSMPLAGK